MPDVPDHVRSKLAVSLDVDDLVVALRLARQLAPWFGTAKVGLELYSSVGPDAVTSLSELGFDVFCDLKFYDIATTVNKASRVIGIARREVSQPARAGRRGHAPRRCRGTEARRDRRGHARATCAWR